MEEQFAAIRDGLRRLRESAGSKKVFGSGAHSFRTHPPLSEEAVREFEARHGCALPPEYRGFLIHIGNGGAGPAYGLFRLGEMDDGFGYESWEGKTGFVGELARPFPHSGPWNDLSEEPPYDDLKEDDTEWEAEYHRQLTDWENRVYWNPAAMNGAVPICHLGCARRQWLVVAGPEAGNVWDDDRADRMGVKPLQRSGQDRVTFLQWYCSWLEEALRLLK